MRSAGESSAQTGTRLDSNSCVDDGFFLRLFSLDTPSSTYFPLFKLAIRPRSTLDSSRHRLSISPHRNRATFSIENQVRFEHSIRSPSPAITSEREENIQTNDRQMTRQKVSLQFVVDRPSAALRPDRDPVATTSLATASTGTVLFPSQMSQIAGDVLH